MSIPPTTDSPPRAQALLVARIDAALPQTQCTRCGYPDCLSYAQAIADGAAGINQCPPGGAEGVARLARITGQPALALSAEHGIEGPRTVAFIDEAWCIGCTLCIKACPTDAIVGANKVMHTIIEPYCTGCELCVPVCPVDCIHLENVTSAATGWSAWSVPLAQQARERYAQRGKRIPSEPRAATRDATGADTRSNASASVHNPQPPPHSSDNAAASAPQDPAARKAAIAAVMERARQRKEQGRH